MRVLPDRAPAPAVAAGMPLGQGEPAQGNSAEALQPSCRSLLSVRRSRRTGPGETIADRRGHRRNALLRRGPGSTGPAQRSIARLRLDAEGANTAALAHASQIH